MRKFEANAGFEDRRGIWLRIIATQMLKILPKFSDRNRICQQAGLVAEILTAAAFSAQANSLRSGRAASNFARAQQGGHRLSRNSGRWC